MPTLARLTLALLACAVSAQVAFAKLPPPSDEAKAKAAEAAAKTAWSNKVAAYQLCQAMDRAAANYRAKRLLNAKEAATPVDTPPCSDPGPFVAAGAGTGGLEKAGAHSSPGGTPPAAGAASAAKS